MLSASPRRDWVAACAIALLALACACAPFAAHADPAGAPVPFRILAGHIVVEARINGQGPFPTQIDDGAVQSFLDSKIANQIGLHPTGTAQISSFGPEVMLMQTSNQVGISIGGKLLTGQTLAVANFQKSGLDSGVDIDAIVGESLFKNYTVTLDFKHSLLWISDPAQYAPPDGAQQLPITVGQYGMPLIAATANGAPGEFQVDFGAADWLLLYPGFLAANKDHFSMNGAVTETKQSVSGPITVTILPSGCDIALGQLHNHIPVIAVMSTDPPHFGTVDLAGNIGVKMWLGLIVTLDMKNDLLIVSEPTD